MSLSRVRASFVLKMHLFNNNTLSISPNLTHVLNVKHKVDMCKLPIYDEDHTLPIPTFSCSLSLNSHMYHHPSVLHRWIYVSYMTQHTTNFISINSCNTASVYITCSTKRDKLVLDTCDLSHIYAQFQECEITHNLG